MNVFTYGSLMFPEVWSLVVTGDYRSMQARLDGHARFAIDGETYPGMVVTADAGVTGVVYLNVDDDDLARLDAFEGDEYRRDAVTIVGSDGTTHVAQAYLYLLEDRLLASAWKPDAFAMQRFIETYCRDRLA
ncbi:MAG: gamma-glutamylcyclotransferase family protein [Burkholderiaceae bacterium]